MGVSVPRDRCYYYECSEGMVRLTYFIAKNELSRLISARKILPAVREDFPDGVDLDCTEPDFADFEAQYGYRPSHSADALRNAFFAIFSSTRGWKTYRGTGLIPADDLEAKIPVIENAVSKVIPKDEHPTAATDIPAQLPPLQVMETLGAAEPPRTFRERRRRREETVRMQSQVRQALADLRVEGVDQKKPIDDQSFTNDIAFTKGMRANEVFARLQHRQPKRERGTT